MFPYDTFKTQGFPEELQIGQSIDAYISDVKDPTNFYVQLKSTESDLNSLMNSLENFYCDQKAEEFKWRITRILPGLVGLCIAALFCNETGNSEGWHRALITGINDPETVNVFYVDYGTMGTISIRYCKFLHRKFATLGAQGIAVKCGGIKPLLAKRNVEPHWSYEAINRFRVLAFQTNQCNAGINGNQGVVLIIMAKKAKHRPEVLIYDTVSNQLADGICLNEVLLNEGLARKDNNWTSHGLLPWQHAYQQFRQRKIEQKGGSISELCPNVGSWEHDEEKPNDEVPKEMRIESFTKVTGWLKNIDETVKENSFDDM